MVNDHVRDRILDLADRIVDSCLDHARSVNFSVIWWSLCPTTPPSVGFSDVLRDRISETAYGVIWAEDLADSMPVVGEVSDDELVAVATDTYLRILIEQRARTVSDAIRPETEVAGHPVVRGPAKMMRRSETSSAAGLSSYVAEYEASFRAMKVAQTPRPWIAIPFLPIRELFYFRGAEAELKASMEIALDQGIRDVLRDGVAVPLGGLAYAFLLFRGFRMIGDKIAFVGCHVTRTIDGLPMCPSSMSSYQLVSKCGFIFSGGDVLYIMDCGPSTTLEALVKI